LQAVITDPLSLDANQQRKRLALKINIMSLTDVNKNMSPDDKLLHQSDCYGLLLHCSCTTYVIK